MNLDADGDIFGGKPGLLWDLLSVGDLSTVSIQGAGWVQGGTGAASSTLADVPVAEFKAIMRMRADVFEAASLFAFLVHRHDFLQGSASTKLIVRNDIASHVAACISKLDASLESLGAQATTHSKGEQHTTQWTTTVAAMSTWQVKALACLTSVKASTLAAFASCMEELAKKVTSAGVDYSAYINATTYNKTQTSKHLINWKAQPQHTDLVLELMRAGKRFRGCITQHARGDDDSFDCTIKMCDAALASGRRIITVRAVAMVIQATHGSQQKTEAAALLQKITDEVCVPEIMRSELAKIAGQPAKKKARTA